MEKIILVSLLLVEIVFIVISFIRKSDIKREKSIIRLALFLTFIILIISPIINWNLKWLLLSIILGFQAIRSIITLKRKTSNSPIKRRKIILIGINRIIIIVLAIMPSLILPQYDPIKITGEYEVDSASYTLIDPSRLEYFTEDENDNRKLSVEFWYPSTSGKYPLVIFSHGAFGYRMSNFSTYEELASNGYIVASIDHTYHAFMTKEGDGKVVIANMEFINNAMKVQSNAISNEDSKNMTDEWMDLRTKDMEFVLDYIRDHVANAKSDDLFNNIDLGHIGLFGHSLGGATSAQVGRIDSDIDAVIVVDGTMLGESPDNPPYEKPILNIYNESHYDQALEDNTYPNIAACKFATESYDVIVKGSGHMNFTDLPIVSPFLSKLLENGEPVSVDSRYCIESTNEVILQFFNKYLKSNNIEFAKVRIY